jgi:hypothetical protein
MEKNRSAGRGLQPRPAQLLNRFRSPKFILDVCSYCLQQIPYLPQPHRQHRQIGGFNM